MNIRPLHDRVLIRRLEEKESKVGGIIIPDSAKEKPQQGEVIAPGQIPEVWKRIPPDLKGGDHALFGKNAGMDVIIGDEDYVVMREREILGRIGIVEKAKRARK